MYVYTNIRIYIYICIHTHSHPWWYKVIYIYIDIYIHIYIYIMYNVYIDIEITASKHMCGNMYVCQLYLYLCGQVTPASTLSRGSTRTPDSSARKCTSEEGQDASSSKGCSCLDSCGKGSGIIYYSTGLLQEVPKKKLGNLVLTQAAYNRWRAKLDRMCRKKPVSGKLDVPDDIHKQWLEKGTGKDALLETLIRSDGNKDRALFMQCEMLLPWLPLKRLFQAILTIVSSHYIALHSSYRSNCLCVFLKCS